MPLRRRLILPLAVLALGLPAAAAPAAHAQDARIQAGISAGGVDLSGLTVAEAAGKLQQALGAQLAQPVVVGVAGKPWTLQVTDAKVVFDTTRTAKRALYAPQGTKTVELAVSHSRVAVRDWVSGIATKVARKARNARVAITLRKVRLVRSRHGHGLDVDAVRKAVDAALDSPTAQRTLHQRLSKVTPALTTLGAKRKYRTVITIDRSSFTLRLFKDLKVRRTYKVAVGQPAYPTPSGLFSISNKQVNPQWSVPNSPWAGELAGTSVEGGSAANPLKARWMGIANGVGIHGTGEDASIGTRASHGCIRMHVSDVIDLYPRVPVGTPVLLK
jgi:lipoprotein-anchoring transpeptidase ErfK/SrfK